MSDNYTRNKPPETHLLDDGRLHHRGTANYQVVNTTAGHLAEGTLNQVAAFDVPGWRVYQTHDNWITRPNERIN